MTLLSAASAPGARITAHSGEANVPEAAKNVRDAIDYLGAERIGHGVQIYKDPETIDEVKEDLKHAFSN